MPGAPRDPSPLEEYRRKRDFTRTHEPAGPEAGERDGGEGRAAAAVYETEGGRRVAPGGGFVVHKHAARRMHYDIRLELDGVLKSWACPKGPSLDPHEKRLAVQVEDHPLEYGSFEGVIPKGEYGGGPVMVWDSGHWLPHGDPHDGLAKGELKFTLAGRKLRGSWVLVRLKPKPDEREDVVNWLLIKERDDEVRQGAGDELLDTPSVKTGRTMQEIADQRDDVWHSSEGLPDPSAVPGARRADQPGELLPELATLVEAAPRGEHWLHEVKFDGYRLLCRVRRDGVRVFTRRGNDWTDRFPTIARAVRALPVREAWVDGELVALLPDGRSSFGSLQQALSDEDDTGLLYYVFDLPYLDGYDLRPAPLLERKQALAALVAKAGPLDSLRLSDHVTGSGATMMEQACDMELEGVVSKRADSPYRSRRTRDWLKTKCVGRQEFVVGGFSEPSGSREAIGALLLGLYSDGDLTFVGRVGTGFDRATARQVLQRLEPLQEAAPSFADPPRGAAARGVHWVRPEVVAEVEFIGWTGDGRLRHPSFKGLRDDVSAADVMRERPAPDPPAEDPPAAGPPARPARSAANDPPADDPPVRPGRGSDPSRANGDAATIAGVRLTHPDRVVYTDQGLTKAELARYYVRVEDWIMPRLAGRPLTLVRCPEGQPGQCFFQKHADASMPDTIKRVTIDEEDGRSVDIYIEELEGLVWLVQMGVLEFHTWGSHVQTLERPDELVFDLDPDEGLPWDRVIEAARLLRRRFGAIGLASFVKTSGGKGLHVVVPIEPVDDWSYVKSFCTAFAQSLVEEHPDRYVATMSKRRRQGKVFVDYLRNGRGATSVAAYSTRSRAGAPVSLPVRWEELGRSSGGAQYDVARTLSRLAHLREDPWQGIEEARRSQRLPHPDGK